MSIVNRLLPQSFDNHYPGHKLGLWLFYPLTFIHVAIAQAAIFTSDGGAQSADGIPLDTYGPVAAKAVIGVVAYLGLANLLLDLLSILALVRYRSMIPLMYVLLVLDYLGHRGIGWMKPIVRTGTASGGYVNAVLFAITILGLILSLALTTGKPPRSPDAPPPPQP